MQFSSEFKLRKPTFGESLKRYVSGVVMVLENGDGVANARAPVTSYFYRGYL